MQVRLLPSPRMKTIHIQIPVIVDGVPTHFDLKVDCPEEATVDQVLGEFAQRFTKAMELVTKPQAMMVGG